MKEIDKIVGALRGVINAQDLSRFFDKFYIFGSLTNDDGQFFVPSGIEASDIDLLIRFDPTKIDSALDRVVALSALRACAQDLELVTHRAIGVNVGASPILSLLPVSYYEIYHCIHKGFDPKIFTLNLFYDIIDDKLERGGLTDHIDFGYHLENMEAFTVIRVCQKIRNSFLKISYNGSTEFSGYDKADPLPKELMRAAALLNFVVKGSDDPELRTRLLDGNGYVVKLLEGRSDESPLFSELHKKVALRSFSRVATRPPLTAVDVLMISETLFDAARTLPKRSVREVIDLLQRKSSEV
jgi:predicted nucleotidyltransferase